MTAGTALDVAIVAALGVWWLASAAHQSERTRWRWVAALDVFALVPFWSFFAPTPGTTDYNLLFRDAHGPDAWGLWREIPFDKERGVLRGLWNPRKRESKMLFDAVSGLLQALPTSATEEEMAEALETLELSMPYLLILAYVSRLERSPLSERTQFAIVETDGWRAAEEPDLLFVSAAHRLPDHAPAPPRPHLIPA